MVSAEKWPRLGSDERASMNLMSRMSAQASRTRRAREVNGRMRTIGREEGRAQLDEDGDGECRWMERNRGEVDRRRG